MGFNGRIFWGRNRVIGRNGENLFCVLSKSNVLRRFRDLVQFIYEIYRKTDCYHHCRGLFDF